MVPIYPLTVARFRTAGLAGAGLSDRSSPHPVAAMIFEREPADSQPSVLTSGAAVLLSSGLGLRITSTPMIHNDIV